MEVTWRKVAAIRLFFLPIFSLRNLEMRRATTPLPRLMLSRSKIDWYDYNISSAFKHLRCLILKCNRFLTHLSMIFDGYPAIFLFCWVPSSWEDHKWQKTKHIHRRSLAALSGKIQRTTLLLQLSAGGLTVFLPCSFASGSGLVLVPCSNEEDLSITLFKWDGLYRVFPSNLLI